MYLNQFDLFFQFTIVILKLFVQIYDLLFKLNILSLMRNMTMCIFTHIQGIPRRFIQYDLTRDNEYI